MKKKTRLTLESIIERAARDNRHSLWQFAHRAAMEQAYSQRNVEAYMAWFNATLIAATRIDPELIAIELMV